MVINVKINIKFLYLKKEAINFTMFILPYLPNFMFYKVGV
jgi:hypothetical protein